MKNSKGYVLVLCPDHPRSNNYGYVREHVLVMEKILGRSVLATEAIHHINGDRTDNSPGNLMLFATIPMHTSFHRRLRAFEACGHYDWWKCLICKEYDDLKNLYLNKIQKRAHHRSCARPIDAQRRKKRRAAKERP